MLILQRLIVITFKSSGKADSYIGSNSDDSNESVLSHAYGKALSFIFHDQCFKVGFNGHGFILF